MSTKYRLQRRKIREKFDSVSIFCRVIGNDSAQGLMERERGLGKERLRKRQRKGKERYRKTDGAKKRKGKYKMRDSINHKQREEY